MNKLADYTNFQTKNTFLVDFPDNKVTTRNRTNIIVLMA